MLTKTCDICGSEYAGRAPMVAMTLPKGFVGENRAKFDVCSTVCLGRLVEQLPTFGDQIIEDAPEPSDPQVPNGSQVDDVQIVVPEPDLPSAKFRPMTEEDITRLTGVEKRGLRG